MKLHDKNGKEVASTLKAMHDAVENTGEIKTHTEYTSKGVRLIKNEDDRYEIKDTWTCPPKSNLFASIDTAYIRFRFLVGAYFKAGLPSL